MQETAQSVTQSLQWLYEELDHFTHKSFSKVFIAACVGKIINPRSDVYKGCSNTFLNTITSSLLQEP